MNRPHHQPSLLGIDREYIPCMSEDGMKMFVDDFVSGRIFTSLQIHSPDCIPMVFMPLIFMNISDTGWKQMAVIWEYMDKACPMAVDGMPTFTSCHIMNVDDWAVIQPAIEREMKRRKSIEL